MLSVLRVDATNPATPFEIGNLESTEVTIVILNKNFGLLFMCRLQNSKADNEKYYKLFYGNSNKFYLHRLDFDKTSIRSMSLE